MQIERKQMHQRISPTLRWVTPPRLQDVTNIGPWHLGEDLAVTNISLVKNAWKGGQHDTRAPHAIKIYSSNYPVELYNKEVEIHRRLTLLEPPHILRLRDSGTMLVGDNPFSEEIVRYVVTDKAHRGSLPKELLSKGTFSPQRAAVAIEQVGSALGLVHAEGLVHADMKPGNVLVHDDTTFLLNDFGLAYEGPVKENGATMPGTFQYFAPEQFFGVTLQESDTYALALTLFYMLIGNKMWDISVEDHIIAVWKKDEHDSFVRGRIGEIAQRELHSPLIRGLAYHPDERSTHYHTIIDFARDVRDRVEEAAE